MSRATLREEVCMSCDSEDDINSESSSYYGEQEIDLKINDDTYLRMVDPACSACDDGGKSYSSSAQLYMDLLHVRTFPSMRTADSGGVSQNALHAPFNQQNMLIDFDSINLHFQLSEQSERRECRACISHAPQGHCFLVMGTAYGHFILGLRTLSHY